MDRISTTKLSIHSFFKSKNSWNCYFHSPSLLIHSPLFGFIKNTPDKYTPQSPYVTRHCDLGCVAFFFSRLQGLILDWTNLVVGGYPQFHSRLFVGTWNLPWHHHHHVWVRCLFNSFFWKKQSRIGLEPRCEKGSILLLLALVHGQWELQFQMHAKSFKGHIPLFLSPKTSLVPWRTLLDFNPWSWCLWFRLR